MKYYKLNGKLLFSNHEYTELELTDDLELVNEEGIIYYLSKMDPLHSRRGFVVMNTLQFEQVSEDLSLLSKKEDSKKYPKWLIDKITQGKVKLVNTSYPTWQDELSSIPNEWRVNILALGDVGSTLAIGLRLLGRNISSIGIYDRSHEKKKRWEYELNQIRRPFDEKCFSPVAGITEKELFDCDMFIFCASKGIPPVGSPVTDVRMARFEGNKAIISQYSRMARDIGFKGFFAVVSDPVDPLCKTVFLESNKNDEGSFDFKGIAPNMIIGFGLGVMNARAAFYAEKDENLSHYLEEGQVFGPHGKGLIVADSMENYDQDKSLYLTNKTVNANMEIRDLGFKPFVAPSLSSGSLSIAAVIQGDYLYGSSLMGDVFMGSKIRLTETGLEVPQYKLDPLLEERLMETYNELRSII